MKYIFVTGGVVSGLGKGITAASLGRLLKERGYKVISQKLDPYINVDPGTMSPYQHGEVFVTEDGAETDLDLGHYERFINENLNKYSNLTTGKVYWNVLNNERKGAYLGDTVQIIPHVTNEIKRFIYAVGEKAQADIVITEIGGTVGDIESQPFIEAIRQISIELPKEDTCYIHVTLVPYISGSNEYKSKPTQHSVRELQVNGIRPNIIVPRCDGRLPKDIKHKIALFCNVKEECIIENYTAEDLYEVPLMLEEQGFSDVVCKELALPTNEIDLRKWESLVHRIKSCNKSIKIALVGKYVGLHDAYLSVVEALKHAGYELGIKIDLKWIEFEDVTKESAESLFHDVAGIILPGGFGNRGIEGAIETAYYARTHNIPYFGICLGMQIAVIEYARNALGYKDANSSEFNSETEHKVIHYMANQNDDVDKGGTMRLGAYPCIIKEDSLLEKCYQTKTISERHRHRYEFNNVYRDELIKNGLDVVGVSPDEKLVEAVEVPTSLFHLGVQYHPEFKSRPNNAHPLFVGFLKASMKCK